MPGKTTIYRSFLLTLWQEHRRSPGSPAVWRFRLNDPRTGQQRGFADLEALMAALKEEMEDDRTEEAGAPARPAD